MTDSKLGPPRLPDPPQPDSPFGYSPESAFGSTLNTGTGNTETTNEINFFIQQNKNTQYLQDLVRSLEFYIATQQRSEIADNYKSTSWFMN